MVKKEGDELARLPYLRTWFRTRSAIVLHLSNGTLQINFFNVSVKRIILGLKAGLPKNREFNNLGKKPGILTC